MKKYTQQILVTVLLMGATAGVAFAGPSFNITTLLAGFIRYNGNGHASTTNCNNDHRGDYCYGYGWSGNLQDWGYGYGYKSKDFFGEPDTTLAAEYGFDGDDGSATIDSIVVDKTTATITYSTNYLAKIDGAYGLTDPVTPYNYIGLAPGGVSGETDFTSGERVWNITGLTCGTVYYYSINSRDAANNTWSLPDSFTTDSCSTDRQTVTGSIYAPTNTQQSTSHNPRGLRLPPITLALGSLGTDVQDLQILLNFFGTFLASDGAGSPGAETQTFGTRTKAALMKFQSTFGLGADGIYGQKTHDVMESFLK